MTTIAFCRNCGTIVEDTAAPSCENCGDWIQSPPPAGCGPLITGEFTTADADALIKANRGEYVP
jgi:hypothetical protein